MTEQIGTGGRKQVDKKIIITTLPHTIVSSDFEVPRLSLMSCVTGEALLGLSESMFPYWKREIRKLPALEVCWEELCMENTKLDVCLRIKDP